MLSSLLRVVQVHLGDGVTRVQAGEKIEQAERRTLPISRNIPHIFFSGLAASAVIDKSLAPDKEWRWGGRGNSEHAAVFPRK